MKHRILGVLAVTAVLMLTACTTTPTQTLVTTIVIQQGTARFIESKDSDAERSERAQEIIEVAATLKTIAADGQSTLANLQAQALGIVARANLEPSDEILANTLVAAVGEYLKEKISDGVLRPEDRVRLDMVLDHITAAARVYVQNSATS